MGDPDLQPKLEQELQAALNADDVESIDFHIRQALQLIQVDAEFRRNKQLNECCEDSLNDLGAANSEIVTLSDQFVHFSHNLFVNSDTKLLFFTKRWVPESDSRRP